MSSLNCLKAIVPVCLTFIGIEFASRVFVYQPVSTTWKELHSNGVLTNIRNGSGLHEFWGNGIKKYAFGEYANRVSLIHREGPIPTNKNEQQCRYLILGDSFSFGALVDHDESFPSLLEAKLNKSTIFDRNVKFINAATGGWGLSDYHAYLEIYSHRFQETNLSGIIVFVNADDGNRAAKSKLYKSSDNSKTKELAVRTNEFYTSSSVGVVKRVLGHPLIASLYGISQRYSNTARLAKRLFLDGQIMKDPRNTPSKSDHSASLGEFLRADENVPLSSLHKAKIDASVSDLAKQSSQLAPLLMVYTGVMPVAGLKPANSYLFTADFMSNALSLGMQADFSTLPSSPLLHPNSHLIPYDGHPNSAGHKVIASHIFNSSSNDSLVNFIANTCASAK